MTSFGVMRKAIAQLKPVQEISLIDGGVRIKSITTMRTTETNIVVGEEFEDDRKKGEKVKVIWAGFLINLSVGGY